MAVTPQNLKMRVSENNGLPWTQTPEYRDLCRTVGRSGDPTAYNPPHPQGHSPTDITQFQVGLSRSNINNLPDVMYQLWPSKEWWDHRKSAMPPPKRDANGSIMYERTPRSWAPRELLDFPILRNLDTISSEEDAWFLELLLRMDGRIEWTDLLMRMPYPGYTEADEKKLRNRLQQRMARFRERFTMVSWRDTAGENNAIRDRVLNKLSPLQLAARGGLGSTRGSTPGSIDGRGGVIPVPGRQARGSGSAAAHQQHPRTTRAPADPTATAIPQAQNSAFYAGSTRFLQEQSGLSHDGHDGDNEDYKSVTNGNTDENGDFGDKDGIEENLDSNKNGNDGSEDLEVEMSSVEEDSGMDSLTVEERRELARYFGEDRIQIQMCLDGNISPDELVSEMLENQAKLKQGLKRARWEISDDEEAEDKQNQRAKRVRRGEDAAESSGQLSFDTHGQSSAEGQQTTYNAFGKFQPSPSGEYNRQGALASTSRHRIARLVGSAVQRLHNDRSRRPAAKATESRNPELPFYSGSQQGVGMGGEEKIVDKAQPVNRDSQLPRYPPQPQHQPGSELNSSVLDGPRQGYDSHGVGNLSDRKESTRNSSQHTTYCQAYQQATARAARDDLAVRDDPFFSDELFHGMLTGQPDNNHVGSMYTARQQQIHDEYYRRLMMSRPRPAKAPHNSMPPPPWYLVGEPPTVFVSELLDPSNNLPAGQGVTAMQSHNTNNLPVALGQGGNTLPSAQAADGGPWSAQDSNPVLRKIAGWNSEWSSFINDHDAEPLLGGHYPDEYPPGPPSSPL